jgi:ABC-2 type transport system ATP-binding protein
MDDILEITGLAKDYKGFSLRDVSFAVPRGTIMGLIGPNGAGKTTVVKLIMNLIRRRAGQIKVFGLDNLADEVRVKGRIGFVYDTPVFPLDISPLAIGSALAPFYPAWDGALFRRLLDEFELPARKRFKTLSHGMKMKFALAVALAHDAELILMDEPTAGLDPVFRQDLLTRLSGLIQDERKSVLFSSHITTDLEKVADYITFIHQGAVVLSGPKDEILETWGLVKAGRREIEVRDVPGLRGYRAGAFGLEVLSSDLAGARRRFGAQALYDKATLEDIMFFISKGNDHAYA